MKAEAAPHHRAPSIQVLRTREAMKAVLPVGRRIGAWQAQTARLTAFAEKLRASGRSEPRLLAEAHGLRAEVEAQRRAFLAGAAQLPPQVADEGRILDTARALKTVMDGLERAIDLLEGRAAAGAEKQNPGHEGPGFDWSE